MLIDIFFPFKLFSVAKTPHFLKTTGTFFQIKCPSIGVLLILIFTSSYISYKKKMHPSNLNILKFDIENDGILNILLTFGGSAYDRLKTGSPLNAYVQCMSYRQFSRKSSSSKFVFKRPNFGFRQTDGQTDGRTDRRNKHILGLPSFKN